MNTHRRQVLAALLGAPAVFVASRALPRSDATSARWPNLRRLADAAGQQAAIVGARIAALTDIGNGAPACALLDDAEARVAAQFARNPRRAAARIHHEVAALDFRAGRVVVLRDWHLAAVDVAVLRVAAPAQRDAESA